MAYVIVSVTRFAETLDIAALAHYRSVVKIKSSGCTGSTSSVLTAGTWTGTVSPDNCVVQYTTLDSNAVTISALAIDGADNLWVRPAQEIPGRVLALKNGRKRGCSCSRCLVTRSSCLF